jgi:hypothetical protein
VIVFAVFEYRTDTDKGHDRLVSLHKTEENAQEWQMLLNRREQDADTTYRFSVREMPVQDKEIVPKMRVDTWNYSTHELLVKIPDVIGQMWCKGHSVTLDKFQCIPVILNFDGSYLGKARDQLDIFLGKADEYCLLLPRGKIG